MIAETSSEPKQPSRFEKKRNTLGRYPAVCRPTHGG
jgi:hypothetical protein